MNRFRKLFDADGHVLQDNFRPVHLKHGRVITYRLENSELVLNAESPSVTFPVNNPIQRPQLQSEILTIPQKPNNNNTNNNLNNNNSDLNLRPVQNLPTNWLLSAIGNRPAITNFWRPVNYFNYFVIPTNNPLFMYKPLPPVYHSWSLHARELSIRPNDIIFLTPFSEARWIK